MGDRAGQYRAQDALPPREGGTYQVSGQRIRVIAIGRYGGRVAVVSCVDGSDRLTIWPREIWVVEYAARVLLGIDATVSQSLVRGFGYWLDVGCLVTQVNGELFLSEIEVIDYGK